ncbi:MAG: lipid II flippase MurJ [Aquabacterium sp.]
MLGTAGLLTLVTLLGLLSGLAREWLLVDAWGIGGRTDGFLVASFLSEAVRTMLAGGLLSSTAMALWQQRQGEDRARWLGAMTFGLGAFALLAAVLLAIGAPWLVRMVGPGLQAHWLPSASKTLAVMAWGVPAMILQALWAIVLQAQGRFLLSGLSSLVYNLPAVLYLWWQRQQADEVTLAWAFVLGAACTALMMLPSAVSQGLRLKRLRWDGGMQRELTTRLVHVFGGAATGQAVMLLERIVASYLGDGAVTVLNLARKLANLPLVALMSVNQVLLGLMSKGSVHERLALLRQGLALNTVITTPAAIGMLLSAQAVATLLFPRVRGEVGLLGPLLGWYAVALILAGWGTLLARYNQSAGDTRLPFICEMSGNAMQAMALPLLAWIWGAQGIAMALLLGVLVNCAMLMHLNRLWTRVRLPSMLIAGGLPLALSAQWLLPRWPDDAVWRLAASTLAGVVCLGMLIAWLKPWKAEAP